MRLIDADALKDVIQQHDYPLADRLNSVDNGMFTLGIFQAIDEQPTISPDEVRGVGEWICDPISAVSPVEEWYCNICKQPAPMGYGKAYVRTNYCPNCGSKMEVSEDA